MICPGGGAFLMPGALTPMSGDMVPGRGAIFLEFTEEKFVPSTANDEVFKVST